MNKKKIFQAGLKITVALQKEACKFLYSSIWNEEEMSKISHSLP